MTPPTAPDVDSPTSGMLPRILSPDEFHQAKQLPPEALATDPFPVLPPTDPKPKPKPAAAGASVAPAPIFPAPKTGDIDLRAIAPFPLAPSDATRRLDPNSGAPDTPVAEQASDALLNSPLGRAHDTGGVTGAIKEVGGALTRRLAAPIVAHPFLTAATAVAGAGLTAVSPAVAAAAFIGPVGKDVVEYFLQTAAEHTLDPHTRAIIAKDPEYQAWRISGEQAAVEGGILALAGLGAVGARVATGKPPLPSITEGLTAVKHTAADFLVSAGEKLDSPKLAAERRTADRAANTDDLTGLANQRAFRAALPVAEADPDTHIIRLDINGFKDTNDAHGHPMGDAVLKQVGQTLRENADGKVTYRSGKGDEFSVITTGSRADADALKDRLVQAVGVNDIEGVHVETGEPVTTRYSVSAGVGGTDAEADAAMYRQKAADKAAQGIPDRESERVAAAVPSPAAPSLQSAFDDWNSGRAYLGHDGNYRLKRVAYGPDGALLPAAERTRTRIAPWNKAVKAAFADNWAFHNAAHAATDAEGVSAMVAPNTSAGRSTSVPKVTPQLQDAVEQHVADVSDALDAMTASTAPTTQGVTSATRAASSPGVGVPAVPEHAGATAKTVLRANLGESAANYEQAAFKVDEFRRAIDWLPENDKLGFVDAMEGGQSQPSPEFQPLADFMRKTLDTVRDQIRALGTGKLEQYIQNYFPHSGIWADPDQAEMTFKQLVGGRRPLEGSKSFLKERSIPTVMDGVRQGLPLADGWNPIDVFLSNYRDMQRYLFAHRSFTEGKDLGIIKFLGAADPLPDGYGNINDRIATVFGKPTVTISEAFDAQQRAAIEHAIDALGGVSLERKTAIGGGAQGLPAGALGYAKGDSKIVAKFGTHDGVLMHELGHIIDTRFGMGAELAKAPNADAELGALADLRHESNPKSTPEYRAYVQKPEERAANALHAFLHAPERMQEVAPNVYQALDKFVSSKPELRAIRDIKPSVELGTAESEIPVGGMVVRGRYVAPKDVATVFNNHLSPGLPQILRDTWGPQWGDAAARTFDLYRGLGSVMNSAQLSFSAFHLGMTSLDAAVSRAALGIEEAAAGHPLRAAKHIVTAPAAPVSGLAQGLIGDYVNKALGTNIQMGLGAKIRQAYLTGTGSPEMLSLAQAVREAGGRVTQDSFYKTSAPERFLSGLRQELSAIKEGRFADAMKADWAAGKVSLPALLELTAKPIMEHVVPLQKLQVFGELAQKVLRGLPPDATLTARRAALQSVWDSVDNRMGQLVYDNLFWNRVFKDLAMASTRSVGWNLGTIREVGGGYVDLAKDGAQLAAKAAGRDLGDAALTHRAAYAIALPLMIGMAGAAYQYLRTGQGPSELKDYFHPKTGEQDADGNDERVQLPSYMKDLAAYSGSPWQTVTHKVAPFPAMIAEMLNNQDFFGDEIRNPLDPAVTQIQQEAEYIGKAALPFSLTNEREDVKRGDQSEITKVGNWFGVTPASRRVVRSKAQNLMSDMLASKGPASATPEDAVHQQERSALLASLRGVGDIDVGRVQRALDSGTLTPADIGRLLKRAGMTPAQEKFKRLTLGQALEVFDASTDREKALFASALMNKLQRAVER